MYRSLTRAKNDLYFPLINWQTNITFAIDMKMSMRNKHSSFPLELAFHFIFMFPPAKF